VVPGKGAGNRPHFSCLQTFKRVYEDPIVRSRQRDATPAEKEIGEARADELNRTIQMFVLRRTKDINERYLPPKTEMVVFCRPSELQLSLYRQVLSTRYVRSCMQSSLGGTKHLIIIAALKHLCNSPLLLKGEETASALTEGDGDDIGAVEDLGEAASMLQAVRAHLPADLDDARTPEANGKLHVLATLLAQLRAAPAKERVLVVSNSTKCLDRIQALCDLRSWPTLRLQGSTPTAHRLELVNRFNSRRHDDFALLMSSKAGGVGLNIIGASRFGHRRRHRLPE
jgi:DNA repair and recombination protein RAD54B